MNQKKINHGVMYDEPFQRQVTNDKNPKPSIADYAIAGLLKPLIYAFARSIYGPISDPVERKEITRKWWCKELEINGLAKTIMEIKLEEKAEKRKRSLESYTGVNGLDITGS